VTAARSEAQGAQPWPTDDELVELIRQHRTITGAAGACGKARESLRDYLRLRPELAARVTRYLPKRAARTSHLRKRARAIRVRRAKRYTARRADPDSVFYDRLVRRDPCGFPGCKSQSEVTDHVHPYKLGGEDHWTNYSGMCRFHNGQKNGTPLLEFLLAAVNSA
jgi:5-methylcytosine-specific restriction endonuclease McrA